MDNTLNIAIAEEYRSFRKLAEVRRCKQRKKLLLRFVAAVFGITMLILGFLFFAPSVKADAESTDSYEKRIISVRVEENDSLWKIAERYYCEDKESIPEFINDIKRTNHLKCDTIYPDTYLVIQYYVK